MSSRPSRKERLLAVLRADPGRKWHGRDLARTLGIANVRSFCVQLSRWARDGLIYKIDRALYTLAAPPPHDPPAETSKLTVTLAA